ncbi:hypothetical protein [Aquibacillus sediminis]|uniref:hypothetical protein n=1 Tax=Aquibacillus sediminis TaxID=2574734 RepID=UPI001108629C|nr:hypothetical protein [Aquibacillus sediminis]
MWWSGMLAGVFVAFLGSLVLSVYPYLPFIPIFLATVFPSIVVFVIVSYRIKQDTSKLTCWLTSVIALFVISLLAFSIKNYFEAQAVNHPGASLNWDAIIIANILYSSGAAVLLSPLGYIVIKKIVEKKQKMST